ncbi:hypothetical protein EXIGLDRAFT_693200 [Exidia glandulosa HHB12029]|uniref:Uncharacterized protein n=1 Tax=Exidia glandulosa HHB12029 TaxID=1314781 RepID=A0A165HH61_EXIGL|nr:hypothetical protein EXIGLDRAFT_693200 [Exidia glandulosa HHB12029]
MSANGSRYQGTSSGANRSSSRSLQRGDDYNDNDWRARGLSGYAAWNATTASASRSLQRDDDRGYYGRQDYYATPGPYYAYDAQPSSASRSLQRDAYGSSYAPTPSYAAPYQPYDAHYAQYDNAASAAPGPSSYARDSAHERTSWRDYDARENLRARRGSRSRSPPARRDGPSRLPLRRSPSPAPRVWGSSLQARQLPQSRSLQRDGDNIRRESPYAQTSRVSVPQNSSNGHMPVGENTTPGVSVPLEPNQRDPLWGNSVGLVHEPYHFPPPRRLPRVATISLVAEEPVNIQNLQDRIDDLEHDKFSLKQEVDYLREVVKRLEDKVIDAMWASQEQKIYAQGRTTDIDEKRAYIDTSRKGIQEELKWIPNFSDLQRYRAGEFDDSEDESDDEPAMVGIKQDDTLVVNVADQEPGEIEERASDAMYVDDSVHPHEEYSPASPPPIAPPPPPPPPPPPHPWGPPQPTTQPQPTTDSAIITRLQLERDDASYYDDALVQVVEHANLNVAMQNIDKTTLPQVNWNSPTKYDFMIQATNLPIPLGQFNQPFLPSWAWENFDPRRLWHSTVNGAYVAPGSELWQRLALEASSLPFECRSPAQRILVCVAHLFVSSPKDAPLLPACPGETPEPNFRLLLQTNARYVPHGVRRRYRVQDDILYTEWSVADVGIYLRIQMCKNTKSKVKWPDLVRKAVLWGRKQDRARLESVPRTYHAPGPYKGNESSDSEVFEYLASCAFTVEQMVGDRGVVYNYVLRNYRLFEIYHKILTEQKDKTYDNGVDKMDTLWGLMRPHFVAPAEHEPVIRFKVISK